MPTLQDKIDASLRQCAEFLPQGVSYLSFGSNAEPETNPHGCAFCRRALTHPATTGFCRQAIRSAAYQAWITGEPYYFRCWIGLSSFLVPVAPRGKLLGAVEFGGFFYVADAAGELAFVRQNLRRLNLPEVTAELEPLLAMLQTLSPVEARGFAEFVTDSLFSSGVNAVDEFRARRDKYLQQRRIAELLHEAAAQTPPDQDVFALLAAMAAACRTADRDQLRRNLDDFLTRVLLLSGLKTDLIKVYILQLLSLLFAEQVKRTGEPFAAVLIHQQLALAELNALTDLTDICYWAARQVDRLAGFEMQSGEGALAVPLVERVRHWIAVHYAERKCTLSLVARGTGASVPAIVKHLRRQTQRPFHAHVLERRLEEARSLLTFTDLKLVEVAERCGFSDQSHLTRAFKKAFAVPPRRFRMMGYQARQGGSSG